MAAATDWKVVDLFSGCGGLSCGLRGAGLTIAAAVERDEVAAKTYKANFPETELLVSDIRRVTAKDLLRASGGRVDVLVGCAPCQGFCSLTQKHRRFDPRNKLLLDMAELASELRPAVVMMENVPGLLTRGRRIFNRFLSQLEAAGYEHGYRIVQMADFGVPQYRRRLVLLAGRGFPVPFPEPTHSKRTTGENGSSWRTVRDAIGHLHAPTRLSIARRRGGPEAFSWHVVSDLKDVTKARLRAARPGETWLSVSESVRPICHRGGYEGFTNVYGRMSWDQTAPTITSGCTTPAKGRFGHPDRRRLTISVREAALLQTFPKAYAFETDQMEAVCQMIGNAVPPVFAEQVGRNIIKALEGRRGKAAR